MRHPRQARDNQCAPYLYLLRACGAVCQWIMHVCPLMKLCAAEKWVPGALATAAEHSCGAVPKDLQLARRIRGPIAGVSSY